MLRPTTLLPALVAVVATLAGVSPATATTDPQSQPASTESTVHPTQVQTRAVHAPRAAADRTPLSVTIDSLSPSYVPRTGPVRVTGSVTNEDDAPWTTVNMFAFMGETPIRSTAELADAGDVDPTTDVGPRITSPGSYDTIDRIGPGETMQFSITVPHRLLDVTEPGVYWFGVHALGEGPDGRLEGADGRARTFLPLVPRTRQAVPGPEPALHPLEALELLPHPRRARVDPDAAAHRQWSDLGGHGGSSPRRPSGFM